MLYSTAVASPSYPLLPTPSYLLFHLLSYLESAYSVQWYSVMVSAPPSAYSPSYSSASLLLAPTLDSFVASPTLASFLSQDQITLVFAVPSSRYAPWSAVVSLAVLLYHWLVSLQVGQLKVSTPI